MLKQGADGDEIAVASNSDKGCLLARGFFPAKPPPDGLMASSAYPPECERAGTISEEQIKQQLRKLKPYKAPGPDGIPNIILTKCADLITPRLRHIYTALLEKKLSYKPWKKFGTVVLRKPGKPRYDTPKAYRPIALLNTMWKVITAIVAKHLTYVTEKHQLLPANHFGGRPGRTTSDAMHLLTNRIKSAWRAGKVVSVLFLDIEGAFPNANPERLVHNLRKRGVPRKYSDFVRNMLKDRITTLKFDGYASDPIPIDNGIGQGDPLSMVLYQYYNADLLDIPKGIDEDAEAYVDDAFMLATDADFTGTHRKLVRMVCGEGGVENWSKTHSSPLEYSKLALINFAHSSKKTESPALQLLSRTVQPVESTKYLGVFFDRNLKWKVQQAYAVDKGTKWAAQIRRLARPSWGITPKYAKRLFISVAIPRAMYAIDVWCAPTDSEQPGPSAKGSAKVTRQIVTIQRAGALAITGDLRTSPTDALNANAHLLPAPLAINKICHKALIRMLTLPKEHPLHKAANWKVTQTTKRHCGPLQILASTFSMDARKIEKLPTATRNPSSAGKLPFKINIPASKEDSIREACGAAEEIQVFSDGSAQNGKVGAAAVLIRKGRPDRILHLQLGSEEQHTVHEAEIVGILLALRLINTEKRNNVSCAIAVDNQAALQAFNAEMKRPGHHLAREALKNAFQLQKRKKKSKYNLTLRWTAGHAGISGNEKADREAKKAANGATSPAKQLPCYLRRPLPVNPSTVTRKHNDELKRKWKEEWRASKRGTQLMRIDNTTPSDKFLKTLSNDKLQRATASLIAQLRLKHIPLNSYLFRFKRVDKPSCPACGESDESITHFLLTCPNYGHERWALARQVRKKQKFMTVETLLGESDLILPLASYIISTGRFKNPTGEQPTSQSASTTREAPNR